MKAEYLELIANKVNSLFSDGGTWINKEIARDIRCIEEKSGKKQPIIGDAEYPSTLSDDSDQDDDLFVEPVNFQNEKIEKLDMSLRETAIRLVANKFAWYKLGFHTYTAIADCALSQAKTGMLELLHKKDSTLLKEYTVEEARCLDEVLLKKYFIVSVRNHCNDRLQRWSTNNKDGKVSVRARVDLFYGLDSDEVGADIWDQHIKSDVDIDSLWRHDRLEVAIKKSDIDPYHKDLLLLKFVEEKTYAEIIEHFGNIRTEGKYRYDIGKATSHLKELFSSPDDFLHNVAKE